MSDSFISDIFYCKKLLYLVTIFQYLQQVYKAHEFEELNWIEVGLASYVDCDIMECYGSWETGGGIKNYVQMHDSVYCITDEKCEVPLALNSTHATCMP